MSSETMRTVARGRSKDQRSKQTIRSVGRPLNVRLVWFLRALVLVSFLAIWQLSVNLGFADEFFVSSPLSVLKYLVVTLPTPDLWFHTWITLYEIIVSFAIGSVAGILVGIVTTKYKLLDAVLDPFFTALNALPRIALVTLFILWFGLGPASKIVLAFTLVFFIVLANTQAGIRGVDREIIRTANVMGATESQQFIKVILPGAVPSIFAGLRIGLVYSLLGVIVGEMVGAKAGLGQRISFYSGTFNSAGIFGILLVLMIIAVLLQLMMGAFERRLMRWQEGS